MQTNGLLVPGVGNRFNGLIIGGDGIPEDQQGRVDFIEGGDYDRIPFGAPRGLYDAQHLFMPRFSFAYSLNPATVFRGGVGLFYDKPEGNVIFSQLNIPPVLANVALRELQPLQPERRRRRRGRRGGHDQRRRSEHEAALPDQLQRRRADGNSRTATSSRRPTSATRAAA